jgi:FAD synthetase
MLETARCLGDRLVVVLAHDRHNHKWNAVPAKVRSKRLLSLGLADEVLIGRPDSFARSLQRVRPKILALGYDQRLPDSATRRAVKKMGIRIVSIPRYAGKARSLSF